MPTLVFFYFTVSASVMWAIKLVLVWIFQSCVKWQRRCWLYSVLFTRQLFLFGWKKKLGSLVGRYDGTRRAEAGGDREGKSVVCAAVAWRRCRVKLMDLCCTMTLFTAEMLRERSSEAVV